MEEKKEKGIKCNTICLKYFVCEVDRYNWSDQGAAKVANGLLKDLGLVKKGKTRVLICPGKVRRERQKWGRKLEEEQDAKILPGGLYTDGKRIPTLIRDVTETKVRVPGRRGRAAYKVV